MQANWIGRSEGARIEFTIAETGDPCPVFTTVRTRFTGVTFMAIAPEHPLVRKLAGRHPAREGGQRLHRTPDDGLRGGPRRRHDDQGGRLHRVPCPQSVQQYARRRCG